METIHQGEYLFFLWENEVFVTVLGLGSVMLTAVLYDLRGLSQSK